MCVAAEAEDDDGWQEAGHSGGGRGATVVQWRRRNSFAIRSWRMEVEDGQGGQAGVFIIFSFLGGVESYLESYLSNPTINRG
jgi:hypothetical protein